MLYRTKTERSRENASKIFTNAPEFNDLRVLYFILKPTVKWKELTKWKWHNGDIIAITSKMSAQKCCGWESVRTIIWSIPSPKYHHVMRIDGTRRWPIGQQRFNSAIQTSIYIVIIWPAYITRWLRNWKSLENWWLDTAIKRESQSKHSRMKNEVCSTGKI